MHTPRTKAAPTVPLIGRATRTATLWAWKKLTVSEDIAIAAIMIVLVSVVFVQVLVRYLLSSHLTIAWTEEWARILLVWMVFVGSVVLQREDKHIVMDAFFDLCPLKLRPFLLLFADILSAIFLILVLKESVALVQMGSSGKTSVLQWPLSVFSAALLVGSVLMLLHLAVNMVRRFVGGNRSQEDSAPEIRESI